MDSLVTHANYTKIRRMVYAIMTLMFMLAALTVYVDYQGRYDLVRSQREACEAGKVSRRASAIGLRLDQDMAHRLEFHDLVVSYGFAARKVEVAANRDCVETYPAPKLFQIH